MQLLAVRQFEYDGHMHELQKFQSVHQDDLVQQVNLVHLTWQY